VDANGTRFQLLLQRDEWFGRDELAAASSVAWDDETWQVILAPRRLTTVELRAGPGTGPLDLDDRRGAARGRYGSWLRVGRDGVSIEIDDPGTGGGSRFWPPSDPWDADLAPVVGSFVSVPTPTPAPGRLRGITITRDEYLLVGRLDTQDVLVFDLHAGGEPSMLDLSEPVSLLDAAAAASGEVWLLDRPEDGPARLWLLDATLRVCPLTTSPLPAELRTSFISAEEHDEPAEPSERVTRPAPLPLPGDPISVAALGDGVALVLDRAGRGVRRIEAGALDDALPLIDLPPGSRGRVPHDLAIADPGARRGSGRAVGEGARLVVADVTGDQADAYVLAGDGATLAANVHLPMHGSRGGTLAGSGPGQPVHYESADRLVPLVDHGRRRRQRNGSLVTAPLDSAEPGCVWHRLAFDGCVPPGTRVYVSSRAADDREALSGVPWRTEPEPYLHHGGAELAWHEVPTDRERGRGTFELLLQAATGRYLQLRFDLSGDGMRTPRLGAGRVHFPRFSYLRAYLPDVYADDPEASSFVERLLANAEGLATRLEDRIAGSHRLHSVAAAPDEALDWLAGWLGAALDPDWDEARRRLMVTHAADLFRERGTLPGLQRALWLATCEGEPPAESLTGMPPMSGFPVRVVESYRTRRLPVAEAWRAQDQAELAGPRWVEEGVRWNPSDGRDELLRRWRDHAGPNHDFPVRPPADPARAERWRTFRAEQLAVAWADVTADDRDAWVSLLRRRYPTVAALDRRWLRLGASRHARFDQVSLPVRLPDGAAFVDWVDLVTVALPAARAAHHIEVLVPMRFDEPVERRQHRLERAAAVAATQRPAHVVVTVRPYWAACRVGAARVGHDTVVGEGSRYAAIALGTTALARGHLGGRHPYDVTGRTLLGRDRIGDQPIKDMRDD
jgi:phage tail-like protein